MSRYQRGDNRRAELEHEALRRGLRQLRNQPRPDTEATYLGPALVRGYMENA